MSQSSRNKNVLLSTPYVFQRQLSDFLCVETRLNLRKCSKLCQSLVDNMPLTILSCHIRITDELTILLSEQKLGIHNSYSYGKNPTCMTFFHNENERKCEESEAVEVLKIILSNPNLQIENLHLIINDMQTLNQNQEKEIQPYQVMVLQHIVSMISSLPHKINVQTVCLVGNVSPEEGRALLSYLKSEKLQTVKLSGKVVDGLLNELAELDQIKQVPAVFIYNTLDRFPFDVLSNTAEFGIILKELSQTEFDQIIERFSQREKFKKARLEVSKSGMEPWITEFLSRNKAVKKDEVVMVATLEGPIFKNIVKVREESIVIKRKM